MKRILAFVSLLIVGFPLPVFSDTASTPIPADRIVAVVNDDAITQGELRARLAVIERQMRSQNAEMPSESVMERQMLEKMITDRVQLQYARDSGLAVTDPELDATIERIAENNHMTLTDFRAALAKDGIEWDKFREEIRDEVTLAHLREREVDSRLTVSDGEIDNFLANPVSEKDAGQVTIAHVLIRVPEQASPEQLTKLRTRAEQALAQVKSGEDFGKVAASYSDAPDAMTGGLVSTRPVDRLPVMYADAVAKLTIGEVSPIMRSAAGFHFIKLIERKGDMQSMQALKQTHVRHILIRVNEVVSDDEAKHKLEGVKERLDHGGDFAELARLYSNDLTAAKGGDLGWLYQGDTVPEFERTMDTLKVGEVSQPVKTPFGWHLIQVLERRTDEGSPERKRTVARMALRERKADEAYQDWVRQLRDRAYVEYHTEDR